VTTGLNETASVFHLFTWTLRLQLTEKLIAYLPILALFTAPAVFVALSFLHCYTDRFSSPTTTLLFSPQYKIAASYGGVVVSTSNSLVSLLPDISRNNSGQIVHTRVFIPNRIS